MNRKEPILIGALIASFVLSGFANTVSSSSPNVCNAKCVTDNLRRPVISGNFTIVSACLAPPLLPQCPFVYANGGEAAVLAGGVSNYGTNTALNVNMTLYWTISYPPGSATGTIQQMLGVFTLGNIAGRTTQPFSDTVPVNQTPLPYTVDVVNATFAWTST